MSKYKVWYCIVSNGDGSYTPEFFSNEEDARFLEEAEQELFGEGPTDAVGYHILNTEDFDEQV